MSVRPSPESARPEPQVVGRARAPVGRVRVEVTLKPGIRDPQGHAIEGAIANLGYDGVRNVRVGKLITLEVSGTPEEAERRVRELCDRLLANPVVENYAVHLEEPREEREDVPPGNGRR